jgi:hypothetical protein
MARVCKRATFQRHNFLANDPGELLELILELA